MRGSAGRESDRPPVRRGARGWTPERSGFHSSAGQNIGDPGVSLPELHSRECRERRKRSAPSPPCPTIPSLLPDTDGSSPKAGALLSCATPRHRIGLILLPFHGSLSQCPKPVPESRAVPKRWLCRIASTGQRICELNRLPLQQFSPIRPCQ